MEMNREFDNPVCEPVDLGISLDGIPEITNLSYDSWTVKITLYFPGKVSPVYLIFKSLGGFRVLDEGNLLEFWTPEARTSGWVWHIISGGWTSLEKMRDGYLDGQLGNERNEYLVLGLNACVSIISSSAPQLIGGN